jgi:hypothetical protein
MRQHFYTTNAAELQNAISTQCFKEEGIACLVYQNPADGQVPFYRSQAKSGGYLYTTQITERDAATAAGQKGEGIACFVDPVSSQNNKALLRSYNPATDDHLYTTDPAEIASAQQLYGYAPEGIAGYVMPAPGNGLVPLYRLFKKFHLYTIDSSERDQAIQKHKYQDEGIAGYVFPDAAPGPQPLYRSRHPKTGSHFYTVSIAERDDATNKQGHVGEGIACNMYATAQPDHIPLLRVYRKVQDDYFYSTDQGEITNAAALYGYKNQVIAGFVPTGRGSGVTPFYRLYGPKAEGQLDFSEQIQLETEWCWAASTVSVSKYYDPGSPWSQCSLVNQQFKRGDCCSNGSSSKCNVPWFPERSLKEVGHLAKHVEKKISMDDISGQICASQPITIGIDWTGGGGHNPVLTGFDLDLGPGSPVIWVEDPIYGPSLQDYQSFPANYQGGAKWDDTYLTKP